MRLFGSSKRDLKDTGGVGGRIQNFKNLCLVHRAGAVEGVSAVVFSNMTRAGCMVTIP